MADNKTDEPVPQAEKPPEVVDTNQTPKEVTQNGPKESPSKRSRLLGKEQGLPKSFATGLVSMTLSSEVVTLTPVLDRIPLLARWIEEVMPRPVYRGYDPDIYIDRLAYVTLFMVERCIVETCKTLQSGRKNLWIGDTSFLLPDPMASFVEGLAPWKSPQDITVEVSLSRVRGVIQQVCEVNNYPWLDDELHWDAGWLAAWQDITSKVESRGTARMRKIGKTMANASLIGAGILLREPSPEAVADIRLAGEVCVVGKKLTARQEALVAAIRPFYYSEVSPGCFIPYLREEDMSAVAACSGYYQGVGWTVARIKYCLLQTVVAST